ncbi:hypothetical protein PARPLA_03095 [Rhodobacteraceae bacterium THAF1]|uniref:histidine phosphotransferase family protein n=1 Tax=Palleronia sp. THAF1 TaxID=2587842 RepID=UPI000F3F6ACA|nr:histidine phosphotransferase family protein [Palleronia sp. THAF1]QFU08494.1 hypothetical protein FIU81_07385 [Palleronia sp. THAF1]VDC29460.1 hypothetical protein PARPLA_03095 [Rhodobacteraceae bacterium THAF1]
MTQSDLSALIGSRICHDLISPLGAIGNGLELLQMSGVGDSPEMALIRDSVETANARVRLFRIAFGAAAPDQRIGWPEVAQGVQGFADRKLTVEWTPMSEMSRAEARLGLLLLMCAETLMPRGGSARVRHQPMGVEMTGERFRPEPEFLGPLTDSSIDPPASEVHFTLARRAASQLGRRIEIQSGDGTMTLTAV